MKKNNNGIYLIQRKNSVIQRCMLLFLAIYTAIFLIAFIPMNIGMQGYVEEYIPFFKFLSIELFILFFPYFAMIMLVALFYNCNDKIEFNSIKNTLIVNNTEHKILKTNAIKLMTSKYEQIAFSNYASGILIFTLKNNKKVCALSLFPKSEKYPEAFNFDKEGHGIYNNKSGILMYLTGMTCIILALAFAYSIYPEFFQFLFSRLQ